MKNGTWKLVDPLVGTKPIGRKWAYKNKYKSGGSLGKHKATMHKKMELTMKKHSPPQQNGLSYPLCSPWQHKMGGKSTKWM